MNPRRLVVLVEGQGDVTAAPILLKRLFSPQDFQVLFPDPHPLRVGEYSKVRKKEYGEWRRFLQVAAKRKNLGACLLLLDGDSRLKVGGEPFCAMRAAIHLAEEARRVGAGSRFSVAIVFACMEFESWLIAGASSLAGKPFPDGRDEFPTTLESIPDDPETAPRDAKGWFRSTMKSGYRPTRDQAEITQLVDIELIRQQEMRSFRRMEHALRELVGAVQSGTHVVTPASGT